MGDGFSRIILSIASSYGFPEQPAVDERPKTVRRWNVPSFSFEGNDVFVARMA